MIFHDISLYIYISLYISLIYHYYNYIIIYHYNLYIINISVYTPSNGNCSTNFDKRQTVHQMALTHALAMVPPMARRWVPWSHFCPGGATMRWTGDRLERIEKKKTTKTHLESPGWSWMYDEYWWIWMKIDEYWWIMMSWWCCSKFAFGHSMHQRIGHSMLDLATKQAGFDSCASPK